MTDEKMLQKQNEIIRLLRMNNAHLKRIQVGLESDRCEVPDTYEIRQSERRFTMYLPFARHDHIQSAIVESRTFYQIWLLLDLAKRIPAGNYTVLDCGANIGNHALFFSAFMTTGDVHAFEPQPQVFEILEKNVELNPALSIKGHNVGLGSEGGTAAVRKFTNANTGATALEPADSGLPIRSLDSYDFADVGFIKIDVEGMQRELLKGAKDLISEQKPYLCIEENPNDPEVRTLMSSLGYGEPENVSYYDWLYRP